MSPLAASRLSPDEDQHLPPASIVDAVASIARKELAPLAADIDSGKLFPGALPWVSNLGPNPFFGPIFEVENRPGEIVMFLADCSDPAVTLQPCKPFLAMDGTGTYSVQFRDAFIPGDHI